MNSPFFNDPPTITTTQCDPTDFVTIGPVEIRGRQFPWDKNRVLENLKDENLHCVRTTLNYRCQAWCVFSVVESDIVIHRLTVRNGEHLSDVLWSLFGTITYNPTGNGCHVSLNWPEYGTDDLLFRQLLSDGWQTAGLIPRLYEGYGEVWDGIKLEKQF